MRFFIPRAKDKAEEQQVYSAVKQHLLEELGANCNDRKIFSLRYRHDGREYGAEVGQPHLYNSQIVISILYEPLRDLYHVCTDTRGVFRGNSILVGGHDVLSAVDFESDEEGDDPIA